MNENQDLQRGEMLLLSIYSGQCTSPQLASLQDFLELKNLNVTHNKKDTI